MKDAAGIEFQQILIVVSGELNFTTVAKLWKESLPRLSGYSALNFDLAKVTSSNSAGAALLLEWLKYAKQENKPIQFNNIPAHLSSILSVSGISNMVLAS